MKDMSAYHTSLITGEEREAAVQLKTAILTSPGNA